MATAIRPFAVYCSNLFSSNRTSNASLQFVTCREHNTVVMIFHKSIEYIIAFVVYVVGLDRLSVGESFARCEKWRD